MREGDAHISAARQIHVPSFRTRAVGLMHAVFEQLR